MSNHGMWPARADDFAELMGARAVQHTATGVKPIAGGSKILEVNANTTALPDRDPRELCSFKGPAGLYIISMRAEIQRPPTAGFVMPCACFLVQWQIGGVEYSVEVDGESDQFLTVTAESIEVYAKWDNVNQPVMPLLPANFPFRHYMGAAIFPAFGASTLIAKRSFWLTPSVGAGSSQGLVPYGARSFQVRSSQANYYAGGFFQFISGAAGGGGLVLDQYSSAQILAAHNIGSYLPVHSLADNWYIEWGPGPAGNIGTVEFILSP